ncbi:MAG: hypothetical protein HY820_21435 [Acidobacteria bacterium]|nr:hypothetical protein [Acidobacteriota bacterium]
MPASAPSEMPAELKPLATVCALAGCQRREISPLPMVPEIAPDATVRRPVVVLWVITELCSA